MLNRVVGCPRVKWVKQSKKEDYLLLLFLEVLDRRFHVLLPAIDAGHLKEDVSLLLDVSGLLEEGVATGTLGLS